MFKDEEEINKTEEKRSQIIEKSQEIEEIKEEKLNNNEAEESDDYLKLVMKKREIDCKNKNKDKASLRKGSIGIGIETMNKVLSEGL